MYIQEDGMLQENHAQQALILEHQHKHQHISIVLADGVGDVGNRRFYLRW